MLTRTLLWVVVVIAGALLGPPAAAATTSWSIGSAGARGSAMASGAPAPPGSPTASCVAAGSNRVTVSWSAAPRATGYGVYQATASAGPYSQVATVSGSTTWTSGALPGAPTTYFFTVTASIGASWGSAQSTATAGRTIGANGRCS